MTSSLPAIPTCRRLRGWGGCMRGWPCCCTRSRSCASSGSGPASSGAGRSGSERPLPEDWKTKKFETFLAENNLRQFPKIGLNKIENQNTAWQWEIFYEETIWDISKNKLGISETIGDKYILKLHSSLLFRSNLRNDGVLYFSIQNDYLWFLM